MVGLNQMQIMMQVCIKKDRPKIDGDAPADLVALMQRCAGPRARRAAGLRRDQGGAARVRPRDPGVVERPHTRLLL